MAKSLEELQAIAYARPARDYRDDRRGQVRPSGRVAIGGRDTGGALLRLHAHRSRRTPSGRTATASSFPKATPRRCSTRSWRRRDTRPIDQLNTLRKLGSIYQGHPDMRFIPSLEASTGSLGEGLSLAIGMGLARAARRTAVRAPTSCWAMAKSRKARSGKPPWRRAFHKVDNIVAIVDYNGIQLDGFVKDIMEVAPLADKWRAFGWHTLEIDGHDLPAIQKAFARSRSHQGQAHLHRGPHHQGQGRFVHGEQPQVPRHGAHAGRSQTGPTGAAITCPRRPNSK